MNAINCSPTGGGCEVRFEEIRFEAAALHRLLIAPIERRLASADQLVIVPDRQLYAVPFAMLYDASRRAYLVERFAIRFARGTSSTAARWA